MKECNLDGDICVIGAGPAGCVTAQRLCELGYSVIIIEAQPFPRPSVGICLSDESYPLMDYLGVRKAVEQAQFFQRNKTMIKWETDQPKVTPQPGFHVDRGIFDQILLNKAIEKGARVMQPARVKSLTQNNNGWVVKIANQNTLSELRVSFIVDAAGQNVVLPTKKTRISAPLFAIHAKWILDSIPAYDGFIEAGEDAWLWFAQVNDQEAIITLFTDPKHFSQSAHSTLTEHYLNMLEQFTLLNRCKLNHLKGEVKSCDASSRYSNDPVGLNYIRVGDANLSVDPIASQGVHLAMSTAVQAAVVVNTLLKYPENADDALSFYKDRQLERVKNFKEKTAAVYAQIARVKQADFWKNRSAAAVHSETEFPSEIQDLPTQHAIQLNKEAVIRSIPVLEGERIISSQALYHPSLKRPVAYLAGVPLIPLLKNMNPGDTVAAILELWTSKLSNELALQIISWLWSRGIIEKYDDSFTDEF